MIERRADGWSGPPVDGWWWDVITPDPAADQHFLTDPGRLAALVMAAGIGPDDRVLELGAGVGTVAAALPPCRTLTLVELDPALAVVLRGRFPAADVRCVDALTVTDPCDVLITNLPGTLAGELLATLPRRRFRTALLTLPVDVDVPGGEPVLDLRPGDFRPPQPGPSRVWRL